MIITVDSDLYLMRGRWHWRGDLSTFTLIGVRPPNYLLFKRYGYSKLILIWIYVKTQLIEKLWTCWQFPYELKLHMLHFSHLGVNLNIYEQLIYPPTQLDAITTNGSN